jgi:hypothetical protein
MAKSLQNDPTALIGKLRTECTAKIGIGVSAMRAIQTPGANSPLDKTCGQGHLSCS